MSCRTALRALSVVVFHCLVCLCFLPGVLLSSSVTGACPVTTDLNMRVNVRTTKTGPLETPGNAYPLPNKPSY